MIFNLFKWTKGNSKRVTRRAVLHYFNSFIYKYLLKFQKSFFTEIYSKTSGKPRKQAFFYSKNHGITIAGRSIGALPIILKSRRLPLRSKTHRLNLHLFKTLTYPR